MGPWWHQGDEETKERQCNRIEPLNLCCGGFSVPLNVCQRTTLSSFQSFEKRQPKAPFIRGEVEQIGMHRPLRSSSSIVTVPGHDDIASSFIIMNGNHSAIVDCGSDTMITRIQHYVSELRIGVSAIILTHTHYDHARRVRELREVVFPRAKIIVHENESERLSSGYSRLPGGTNFCTSLVVFFGHCLLSARYEHFPGVDPDIIMRGDSMDLSSVDEIGNIPATLLHTPGHTDGSISILVGRQAVIGDLIEYGGAPAVGGFPGFADDVPELGRSWRKLLNQELNLFHCSHGVPMPRSVLKSDLRRHFPRLSLRDSAGWADDESD